MARTLPKRNQPAQVWEWIRRLEDVAVPRVALRDLYQGEHWSVASSLSDVALSVGLLADLWGASAGYGLVPAECEIKPYAATFATGHADCVARAAGSHLALARRRWWSDLASWTGPSTSAPRTLAQLAEAGRDQVIIAALSSTYLSAIKDDLLAARRVLKEPGLMLIISAGSRPSLDFGENLLPVDASVQGAFRGSKLALNARAAHWLVATAQEHGFTLRRIRDLLAQVPRGDPNASASLRKKRSDAQVLRFIIHRLARDPQASKSTLLREFRDDGFACEQFRFSSLFATARRAL